MHGPSCTEMALLTALEYISLFSYSHAVSRRGEHMRAQGGPLTAVASVAWPHRSTSQEGVIQRRWYSPGDSFGTWYQRTWQDVLNTQSQLWAHPRLLKLAAVHACVHMQPHVHASLPVAGCPEHLPRTQSRTGSSLWRLGRANLQAAILCVVRLPMRPGHRQPVQQDQSRKKGLKLRRKGCYLAVPAQPPDFRRTADV
jgi:hypothetical protein